MRVPGSRLAPALALALGALALGALALGVLARPALAAFPSAEKVARALAKRNADAGRDTALRMRVALHFGDDEEPAATGVLWADPLGRSALELASPKGFVERHLRVGAEVRAARDGQPVEEPRPFLPPLLVMQTTASDRLAAQLRGLGADADRVVLGYEDEHDCWVLGGRAPGRASLWVDVRSHDPVRFDRGDGVEWRLGSVAAFGELEVPAWFETRDPEYGRARLVVHAAEAAAAPDLGPHWLSAGSEAPVR